MTRDEIVELIWNRSQQWAKQQGASDRTAYNFARVMLGIAYSETGGTFDPNLVVDTRNRGWYPPGTQAERSIGIYQLNFGGAPGVPTRVNRTGITEPEAYDPNRQLDVSFGDIWEAYQGEGGDDAFDANEEDFYERVHMRGQGSIRPNRQNQTRPALSLRPRYVAPPPAPPVPTEGPGPYITDYARGGVVPRYEEGGVAEPLRPGVRLRLADGRIVTGVDRGTPGIVFIVDEQGKQIGIAARRAYEGGRIVAVLNAPNGAGFRDEMEASLADGGGAVAASDAPILSPVSSRGAAPATGSMPAVIQQRAQAFAQQQGASPQEAQAFGQTAVAIAWSESRFDPSAVGDGGASVGLFQLHERGRGKGMSVAQRQDPETNIATSLPELWQGFRATGGAGAFAKNAAALVADVSRVAQRPSADALAKAVRDGVFAQGLQYARTGEMPQSGGMISPVPGAGAKNGSAAVAPAVRVNASPVQGQITSRFGEPSPMDSGATYGGQQYANFNKGVDYGVAGGTPVQAVVGGTVRLAADDGQGWGPRVVVVDAEGFEHSYGHLGQLNVQPGQTVEAGQVIGAVGAGKVGVSTGPHLSYDISKSGEPVDPSPWLGQNVRAEGIPAGQQVPAYLSGATAGGAGVVSSGNSDFFTNQIEEAKRQIAWAQQRQAEIRAGRSGQNKAADEEELLFLDDRINQEMERIGTAQAALANERELNPAQTGVSPLDQAAAISGIQQAQTAQNLDIFNAFLGILDRNFANQLGVSNLLRDIFNTNEQNAQAAVASRQTQGQLNLSGRNDVIQAQAMQQAAEIARASEVLARAQWISDIDMRNVERMLPPGTHWVPGLAPDQDLMTAVRRLGLPGAGVRATPVDWAQLDPRQALADAETTMQPTPDFDIAGLRQTVTANEQIAPYTPGTLTAEGVNLPQAPDLAALAPALGNVQSQAGGVTNEGLIDMILGRGNYAPPPPQQQQPTTPITQTTGSSQPAMRNFPITPGTAVTTTPQRDVSMRDFPVVPGTTTLKTDAGTPAPEEEEDEDLLALLKQFGINATVVASRAGTPSRIPGEIVRRGWEFIR